MAGKRLRTRAVLGERTRFLRVAEKRTGARRRHLQQFSVCMHTSLYVNILHKRAHTTYMRKDITVLSIYNTLAIQRTNRIRLYPMHRGPKGETSRLLINAVFLIRLSRLGRPSVRLTV